MKITSIVVAAILACAARTVSASTNLVINGDFSSGLDGWTVTGNADNTIAGAGVLIGAGSSDGSLSQVLSTIPGASYAVSFDLMGWGDALSYFTASFGGMQIYDVTGGLPSIHVSELQTAATSTTLLQFTYRNDTDWYTLMNVAVIAVPEPEVCATLLAGLALLGFAARRKTQE